MLNCIATEKLQPGMVIVQVTKQNGPVKIRKSGLVSSQEMILGLLEMGIQEVQIDPAQTVEIEAPVVQSSATMQLLQQHNASQPKIDHPAHEHFNRSLFLPSVQEIPAQWQIYFKRAMVMSLVVITGLGVGLGAAYFSRLLTLQSPLVMASPDTNSPADVAVPDTRPVNDAALSGQSATTPEPSVTQVTSKQQAAPLVAAPHSPTVASAAESQPITQPQNTALSENAMLVQNSMGEVQRQQAPDEPQQITPQAPAEPLSPELLKRFEKVIQQMDREERYAGTNKQPSDTQESLSNQAGPIVDLNEFPILDESRDLPESVLPRPSEKAVADVPRIDQLPEWLIAELPGMAFSAHMYASVPTERWVRVNGQNRREGELIDDKVRIVQIAPQHVILHYAGHEFSMAAMTDW